MRARLCRRRSMRRYATFANAPREMGMLEDRQRRSGMTTIYDFAEAMMRDGGRLRGLSASIITPCRASSATRDRPPAFRKANGPRPWRMRWQMDEIVTKTAAIMDKYDPDKKVGLYVDEWGTWYDQEPGSHPGFLVSAELPARCGSGGADASTSSSATPTG